jgi:hypothetical protein
MTPRAGRGNLLATLFVAATVFGFGPSPAQAQFGFGGGFGWGFGFSQVPLPDTFINSKALIDAQRDTHIPSRNVYSNNSNSYINHIRDNGFVERFDPTRRDPGYYRYAAPPSRSSSPATTTPTAMTVAHQTPSLPLASFYNADGHIVWPTEAPMAGDLQDKRSIFDQASQGVLAELKKNNVASIATVTDARQKLLDYGRPGLQYVRTHETPRIADTYHLFLLSLYESLAQAVNPATMAAATTAPAS